jgi:hypothetical protein
MPSYVRLCTTKKQKNKHLWDHACLTLWETVNDEFLNYHSKSYILQTTLLKITIYSLQMRKKKDMMRLRPFPGVILPGNSTAQPARVGRLCT